MPVGCGMFVGMQGDVCKCTIITFTLAFIIYKKKFRIKAIILKFEFLNPQQTAVGLGTWVTE